MTPSVLLRNFAACIVALVACAAYGHDIPGSEARLYVDLIPNRGSKVNDLISKDPVMRGLHLSAQQLQALKKLRNDPMPDNWSPDTNDTSKMSSPAKLSNLDEDQLYFEYLFTSIIRLLTPSQAARLQQISWQVDGLKELRDDMDLRKAINLTSVQDKNVADVLETYDPKLKNLYKWLNAQLITSLSPTQSHEEAERNASAWSGSITELEKKRDQGLYSILTEKQKAKWAEAIGAPVQIKWDISVVDP